MRFVRWQWLCLGSALALGCQSGVQAPDEGDDSRPLLRLEGAELEAAFAEGASPVYEADAPFVRLAFMWDATQTGAIEARWSVDGESWSDWAAPEVHFHEEIAHMGTLSPEAPALAYQLRAPLGVEVLTHVAVEPVASLPDDPTESPELEAGYEEGDGMAEPAAAEGEIGSASAAISARGLVIHSRREWRARAPRCVTRQSAWRATIHHTVTPTRDSMSIPARLRQIQSFHMFGRGWCDIGYNYLIARNGSVWVGRGARRMGAHVFNNNSGNVGISFLGTYSRTRLNWAQRRNAARLLRRLHNRFPAIRLNRRDIKGHRQYGAAGGGTECPGNTAYRQLDGIVRLARR